VRLPRRADRMVAFELFDELEQVGVKSFAHRTC
jgi:hypothetical protein